MNRGAINLQHCVFCEDTSLLLNDATGLQRSLTPRYRDTWLMATSRFTELEGKLNRTPNAMGLVLSLIHI